MKFKTSVKLFLSIYIFVYLIVILPLFIANILGYTLIGMFRIQMISAKISDFLLFSIIAFFVTLLPVFIVWIFTRTIKKDGKLFRTMSGYDFDNSSIRLITKRKFGLLLFTSFEMTDYKNIRYFFSNEEELNEFLNENEITANLIEKRKDSLKTALIIKTIIITLLSLFVLRETVFTRKSFRKKIISNQNPYVTFDHFPKTFASNDYVISRYEIYNLREKNKTNFSLKGGYSESINAIIDVSFYSSNFVCKYRSILLENHSYNNDTPTRIVEEKIDYVGNFIGQTIIEEGICEDFDSYFDNYEKYKVLSDGNYIGYSDEETEIIRTKVKELSYYNRGLRLVNGIVKQIDGVTYFSLESGRKYLDGRYIGRGHLYKINNETKTVEEITSFNGKKVLYFNQEYIIYQDYRTIYKYDIINKSKKKILKVCPIKGYENIYTYNNYIRINVDKRVYVIDIYAM